MTSVTGRLAHFGWSRFGGAILVLAVVTACSPAPASPAANPTGTTVPAATGANSAPDASAAAGVLAKALAPLRAASAFGTTVTVDAKTIVSASGRSVGSASTVSVTTGDRTVEYVRIPPKAWARETGGAWVLVAAGTAPASPVEVLGAPTSVTGDGTGVGAVLTAVYPAAALGLTGDPVAVTITIGSAAVRFSYSVTTSGTTTISTTTLRPGTADPITAPAP